MPNVLVVGATRGLGASVAKKYAASKDNHVFATARSSEPPTDSSNLSYIPKVDISTPEAGTTIVSYLRDHGTSSIDTLIITAGYFATESLTEPSFEQEEKMYKTCVIGPTILTTTLANATTAAPPSSSTSKDADPNIKSDAESLAATGLLRRGAKIIFLSSESGSIGLRHAKEGGGNYGHHASKTALNMCAKLLSLDLQERGVAVAAVHPGFMRTEMTRGVGFDKFWDDGGAVTPDEAADSLVAWIETFSMEKTGQYWAPRGAADIGTAEETLGPKDKLPVPLQLPW